MPKYMMGRARGHSEFFTGIRGLGLAGAIQTVLALTRSSSLEWARLPLPVAVRWCGVAVLSAAVGLLCWMFFSLGRNLTDTVVTRSDATFVQHGPYRYLRNPMYTGLLLMGIGIGLALARKAMERIGGRIRAESTPDSGATIYLEIPSR